MIPQGYPLMVRDTAGLWWYVLGWTIAGSGGAARLAVVPVGEAADGSALPRTLVDAVEFDARPSQLDPRD